MKTMSKNERIDMIIRLKDELKAIKILVKVKPLTPKRLMKMKGFENISYEDAISTVEQLREYTSIFITQMNRLGIEKIKRSKD